MPDQSHPKSWRRWLRVTVRGLMVLVLVMGAGLGWWVRSVRIQREAVAAIERAGGWVQYDWGWTCKLDLYYAQITDSGLAQLKGLTKLSTLTLCSSRITDAGLVHLKDLTNLSELDLRATQVTDAGLAHLKMLTKLSKLHLGDTQVTDAGKTQLERALPNLKIDR